MDYPVPAELKNSFPDWIAPVLRKNDPEAWEQAVYWLDNYVLWGNYGALKQMDGAKPGHGLVLQGPVGAGKTTLAATWLNHIAKEGTYTCAFLSDAELAHMLRYRWRDTDVDDEVLRVQRIGVVVVDDLLRLGTQHVPLDVEAFLRMRQQNGLPTIVTLNNAVQLPETLDSLLKTWTTCLFEGGDLRDPDTAR
jgi:hypothetical protein